MAIIQRALDGDVQAILILGSLWILFFVVKYHIELIRIGRWPSVVGQLDRLLFREGSPLLDATSIVRYRFDLKGETYEGRRLAHISFGPSFGLAPLRKHLLSKAQRLPDEKVRIYYNPKKPDKNLLVKPSRIEYGFLLLCYGFFVLVAYLAYIN